jgi:hypothetical protein
MHTDIRSTRKPRKVWNWDEYDEIWGFDNIPHDYPDRVRHAEALADRSERNIPTMLEENCWVDDFARMERRRIGRTV